MWKAQVECEKGHAGERRGSVSKNDGAAVSEKPGDRIVCDYLD